MEIRRICFRDTVSRRIPIHVRVIQGLLYFFVAVFTFLGTMWGFPMLILSLGTLFGAWYFMGLMQVDYEYRLDGAHLSVLRHSGMRSQRRSEEFLEMDLTRVAAIGWDGSEKLEAAERQSKAGRRITYNVSERDSHRGSFVAYGMGTGNEQGRWLKVYLSPNPELIDCLQKICPDKVFL